MKVVFLYWGHNAKNVARRFMSEKQYDIGDKVKHQGEWIVIDDMAEEYMYDI